MEIKPWMRDPDYLEAVDQAIQLLRWVKRPLLEAAVTLTRKGAEAKHPKRALGIEEMQDVPDPLVQNVLLAFDEITRIVKMLEKASEIDPEDIFGDKHNLFSQLVAEQEKPR